MDSWTPRLPRRADPNTGRAGTADRGSRVCSTHDYERDEELIGDAIRTGMALAVARICRGGSDGQRRGGFDLIELRKIRRRILESRTKGDRVDPGLYRDLQLLASKYPASYDVTG